MKKMKWYDCILVFVNVLLRFVFELGTIPMAFIFMGWKIGLVFSFVYILFTIIGLYLEKNFTRK